MSLLFCPATRFGKVFVFSQLEVLKKSDMENE